ncbi:unnamed protein product [Staurois parvus]|uniref:Uncharacterized protein n=2 Tax=Staurois parvus TaxID=386267 RepID=A0ABN9H4Y2_9NEOB|nr:unnamed protein product [Staurois parvus]
MGPYTASSCCCQVQSLSIGSLYASHCCFLHPPHSAMCHFQVSSHCCGFHFCHRVLYGLPLLLPPPPHCGLHTLVLAPVTAQMSEVCGYSKIDGTLCMSY